VAFVEVGFDGRGAFYLEEGVGQRGEEGSDLAAVEGLAEEGHLEFEVGC